MIYRLLVINWFVTVVTAAIVAESIKDNADLHNNSVIVRPEINLNLHNNSVIVRPEINFKPYEDARNSLLQAEDLMTTGGRLQLNERELKANEIFLKEKNDELANGLENPEINSASMHFFKAKPLIEKSKVFQFLKEMPKGAVLHTHTSATVSSKWVVKNIFYMPGLLRCTTKKGISILTFRRLPEKHKCITDYVRISDERKASASVQAYDESLESLINLYTPTPESDYSSIDKVWSKFQNMFKIIKDVLAYLPAYRAYHWQMLEELYNDNVMYAEVRLGFAELYDSRGHTYPKERTAKEIIYITEKFKRQHPNFLGIKLIHSVARKAENEVIQERFDLFKKLHALYPDYMVGFDLVGQEDKGKPLHDFINILNDKPKTSKFFFHAGETNWYGASTDYNLIDALLLNTTRIGHGYALLKHPVLYNAVKNRDIAVEISPISNQVLDLVHDLRNHPGAFYISQNIPIVICNDDPGFWNAKALSYDFYYAIMSLAPNNAGLKTLKQLAWNSIKYSTLQPYEHRKAFDLLQIQWDHFIENVLDGLVV